MFIRINNFFGKTVFKPSFSLLYFLRVAAIRPFATQQMALLVENSAVIMAKGRRNSSAEVELVAVFVPLFFIVVHRCCMQLDGWWESFVSTSHHQWRHCKPCSGHSLPLCLLTYRWVLLTKFRKRKCALCTDLSESKQCTRNIDIDFPGRFHPKQPETLGCSLHWPRTGGRRTGATAGAACWK